MLLNNIIVMIIIHYKYVYNFTANIFQQAISLNTPVDLTNLKLIDNND